MPLSENVARETVNALQNAATSAKDKAKSDKKKAWQVKHSASRSPVSGDANIADLPNGHYELCQCVQRAQHSIDALANVLEGLVWLAAWQHDRGMALIEGEMAWSHSTLPHEDNRWTEEVSANQHFFGEDLAALCEYRKVKPGIFERVYKSMVLYDKGQPYLGDLLDIYSRVKTDVANVLEG